MSSNSLPKNIKFSYSSSLDASQAEHTPSSSQKRKRIFAVEEGSKQFSPFKHIESKLSKIEIREEIYLTIEKITKKLQRMKELQVENEFLRKESDRMKKEVGTKRLDQNGKRQETSNKLEAAELRDKVKQGMEILIRMKDSQLFKTSPELQELYNVLNY